MQMLSLGAKPRRARLGGTETLIIGNCNFCYQSNTDQKGKPVSTAFLTCETSQLYSLEMTGALLTPEPSK